MIGKLLKDIGKKNLAADIDEDKLDKLAHEVLNGVKEDEDDPKRQKWAKDNKENIKLAMQVMEEKSDPWDGCANIKIPLLTESAIQFNARAYPALVPANNIVTCSVTGEDKDGAKMQRADRVGKHMTYQLKDEMEEWEDDMDKGLLILPILGSFFKKTYFSNELGRPESKLVMPHNLIMQYEAPSVARAPRKTEEIEFYPREIKEKKMSGLWLNVELNIEDEENEKLEKFYTVHVNYDLKDTGYKIPYIVTIHKTSSKVVRILPNYTESSIYLDDGIEIRSIQETKNIIEAKNKITAQQNLQAALIAEQAEDPEPVVEIPMEQPPDFTTQKLVKVDPTEYYTRYLFFPSPDGSIYGMGLGQLLGSLNDASDTLINQMLDAGSLSNLQGGFRAEEAKVPSGKFRSEVGEYVPIKTGGRSIKEAVLPFNYPGPSMVAFQLLGFLIDSAKAVANLKDILSGEAPQGETATTSMIKREEGMRIYNAIYKRIWRSFKKEMGIIYFLNAQYLPEKKYFSFLDNSEYAKKSDYSLDMTDIRPVADPSESLKSQKIVKAEAILPLANDPAFNGYEIKKRYLEALEVENIDAVLPPPQPSPPDPLLVKTVAEVGKIEAETKKTIFETAEVISKVIKNIADAESKEVGSQIGMLKEHANQLINQGVGKQGVENGDNTGGNSGMAQPPNNEDDQGGIPGQAAGTV